jgi:VanZ family protein
VILVLTSWPSPPSGGAESGLDKIIHFSMYAILGYLVARALAWPRPRFQLVAALASMTVFAMLDELHQLWIPGRDASIGDWSADVLGAMVGLLVANLLLSQAPARPDPLT